MGSKFLVAALAILLSTSACSQSTNSSRSSSKSYSSKYSKPAARAPKTSYRDSGASQLKHKPITTKRRSVLTKQEEIEYFQFNDCTRYISGRFNGYRCIDRD